MKKLKLTTVIADVLEEKKLKTIKGGIIQPEPDCDDSNMCNGDFDK